MTSRDFCYWLQGFFEIGDEGKPRDDDSLTPKQVASIRKHLALVFVHEIDPSAGPPEHQAKLNEIHSPPKHPADASKPHPQIHGTGGGIVYRC